MKNTKLFIGIFGIVLLGIVGVAGYFLFTGLAAAADAGKARDDAKRKLEAHYRATPFPTSENIEKEKGNLEIIQQWHESVLDDLRAFDVSVEERERNPAVFNSSRETITARLQEGAKRANTNSVTSADFLFGFERYKSGELAMPDNVPRLMTQLKMVEILVEALYKAEIKELSLVKREVFEDAQPATEQSIAPSSGRRAARAAATQSAPAAGRSQPTAISDDIKSKETFDFTFVADEESLVALLNILSEMPMFVVVKSLSIEKVSGRLDYRLPTPNDQAKGNNSEYDIRQPRGLRVVSGRKSEVPVRIQLTVDVFCFKDKEAP